MEPDGSPTPGERRIVRLRLEQLEESIRRREPWDRIEWNYDRVLRAVNKAFRT